MTQLLVSVRDAEEADEALAGGAKWIDLKEPARGPLGAVDAAVAAKTIERIANRAVISAAGGELRDWPTSTARKLLGAPGWSHLKLGLADCRIIAWQALWRNAARDAASFGASLVATAYADDWHANSPPVFAIIELVATAGAKWLLVDTFDKRGGSLIDIWEPETLCEVADAVHAHGLLFAVAGRLTPIGIAALPLSRIDVVGVRSAACGGARQGRVERSNVAALCQLISANSLSEAVRPESNVELGIQSSFTRRTKVS